MYEPGAAPLQRNTGAIGSLGPFGRATLRCREADIGQASDRLGITLPREACRSSSDGSLIALWLGPDEWLILKRNPPEGWVEELGYSLKGITCSLVDVSHRQIAFSIQGAVAERILASGCALDLAPAAYPVGTCTRTMFAKAEIVLWRTAPDGFHLEVWRSFACYVEALLREAENEE